MKNKPIRHKESNRFQFKSFAERINEIDIDVFHRVSHRNEDNNEEIGTFFHETLQKWNLLNLSEGYCEFRKKVRNIVTLPQLLNEKQHVVDTLIEYLKKKDILFLQPLLELVSALAKDLLKDFCEYFPTFLPIIVDLLETKNTDQIEYTFTTLAYLFKFLRPYLIKNVKIVLDLLLPLLSDAYPAYINNFTAESFAFVIRKAKDKDAFVRLILIKLEDNPNRIIGYGKLFFEVISGIPGQFHSCAEEMLLLYFNLLTDRSLNQRLVYNVIKQIIDCILQSIHPNKCNVLWSVLLKVTDAIIGESRIAIEKEHDLQLILQLLNLVITHNNGRMLNDPVPLIKKLIYMIDIYDSRNTILSTVMNVCVTVLLASNIKLMQETSSHLLLKLLSIQSSELLYAAVEKLMHHSSFETLILPHILKTSASINFNSKIIYLLAKIIYEKAPPCLNGVTLDKWKIYTLNVRNISLENFNYLLQELKTLSSTTSLNALWIMIILPHLKPLPQEYINVTKEEMLLIYNKISYDNDLYTQQSINKLSFTFLLSLDTLFHIIEIDELYDYVTSNKINVLHLLQNYSNNCYILNAVDLFFTYFTKSQFREQFLNQETFEILNNYIVSKLNSPFHQIRLITAHIYSLFEDTKYLNVTLNSDCKSAMQLIYLAECEPATLYKYRDRLAYLESLALRSSAISNLNSKYYEFPFRYLMGNLYINFSLLWDPVSKIIAGYATNDCIQFWPVFISELKDADLIDNIYEPLYECNIITELQAKISKIDEKPDRENYKVLLWKCMSYFSNFCEIRNRDLTGLFIDFVNSNYFKNNSEDAKSYSIKNYKNLPSIDVNTENDSDSEKDNQILTEMKCVPTVTQNKSYKLKLLIAQLEIFAKIMNPQKLYREAEIRKIYLDLLSSKNANIQKAALNCLLTYKFKYLQPYQQHLYNLIDEKNLKNELTQFKIDKESSTILDEHRKDFMPILMRILYAKMMMKTGMRTGGKTGGSLRRTIILRYLACIQEEEMMIFVKMAFKPFQKYMVISLTEEPDLQQMIDNIINTIDLDSVIPPKRLQSAVNLLNIMIKQFGGRMSDKLLRHLLSILICILAEVSSILLQSDYVHAGYLTTIKNVRNSCILILARFFSQFEHYAWNSQEINAVFKVAVFPQLEKLHIEGIHSPTPLLKLFIAWSQNPRYYALFIKYREDNISVTPLPYIMRLLLGSKTHSSVITSILEMIERMLTLQDYDKSTDITDHMEVEKSISPLTPILTNLLEVDHKTLSNDINYGSTILLPHIPSVLEYIKIKLAKSNKSIIRNEVIILSRISEFVVDPDICDTLLILILPILLKKAAVSNNDEGTMELTMTIINLIKNVKKPEKHIRAITPLLSVISPVPIRKLLIQLYSTIAERSAEEHRITMIENCNVLVALNAWDHKWIDQPDFQKRLDAFAEINNLIDKNAITLEFGVAIIYNCFFFLKTESDLALRDCSSHCLKIIGPKLAVKYKSNTSDRRYLLDDTIFTLIRKGIGNKNEVLHYQSIAFLGQLARECPEVHPILRDLSLLGNKIDPEVDFFENMQHLQMHRRVRALLKFCTISKSLKKAFNPKTLTQFILPLASVYLCNETFINKNSIIDAAIETVGTICHLLPWYHYEIILKYYLGKLRNVEFQKQVVRLIVIILDSFHYNLSKYKPLGEIQEKSVVLAHKNESIPENSKKCDKDGIANNINVDKETLDEVLNNNDNVDNEELCENINESINDDLPIMEKQILLSQSGARQIVFSISKNLLPQLHRSIATRSHYDKSHKINRKKISFENEEEDLMRVPIALALVKLLQKLPEGILDMNLPGIFMKLCMFLKSRLESVRRVTREILQKIMIALGPKYLHHLLKELNSLLTKGFQVHVLAYTIHAVLVALKPYYKKFDIDGNLQSILSVCEVDLFELSADEKEVLGITKKVTEAKSTKSFDIFHILAEFITESCLLDLICPLKNILLKSNSHKKLQKVRECFKNIVLGLVDNTFIQLDRMLIFLYGIISENIFELLSITKDTESLDKEMKTKMHQKLDCFIIPPEPKNRMGIKVAAKVSKNANVHIIIEFGLKLCHILLKREKISAPEFKPYLEPYVPILSNCLKSNHVKLCTLSLQCLNWLVKMDLVSIRETITDISLSICNILHKYAAAGLSKGDNFELVQAAFKCMSVLVRDVQHFSITTDQLKILLLYVEQDLYDSDKQATAFILLKAIIKRKLVIREMYPIMEKVAALSITSESEHVRLQSRSVFYSYLMDYPLGKYLDKHLSFYFSQLSYEMQPGRLSALEMIHNIITGFPLSILVKQSGLIFVIVGARIVNDNDPICRKLCAKCIKEMIIRIPQNEKSKLFNIVLLWLKDSEMIHRRLAAQLCGIFVTIEKDNFESHLTELLPLLLQQFHADVEVAETKEPGYSVMLQKKNKQNMKIVKHFYIKDPERLKDHHLFQVLQLLLKISAHCPNFLKNPNYKENVSLLAQYAQSLLAHPHSWVRLAASQLIGFILSALDVNKVADLLKISDNSQKEEGYIYSEPKDTLRSLTLDLIAQLQPDMTFEELIDQVIKNLIFIARILKLVSNDNNSTTNQDNKTKATDLSLIWIMKRLRKAINVEVTQKPNSTSVRTAVFKWIAGLIATTSIHELSTIHFSLLSPLVREISTIEESNASLRQLAKEVATMIKRQIDNEEYTRLLSKVQQKLDIKRAERKKTRAQQFVTDPELAAKRKIARQQKKKVSRKRKLSSKRGKSTSRKRPKREVDFDVL